MAVASAVADGRHHARWPDGSEYYGEWRDGRAHGRGAFVWPSGTPADFSSSEGALMQVSFWLLLHGIL